MADYRVIVTDASTGDNIGELPLSGLTFSRVLSGVGTLSGSLSVWHDMATKEVLGKTDSPDRELTVYRDDSAVWNGPITGWGGTLSSGQLNVTAREASWYLTKRVLEVDMDWSATDVFDIVRDLFDYMLTKQGTGDDGMTLGDNLNADIPRFTASAAMAGATRDASFFGSARHTIQEAFELLAADPETGFDWRVDVATGSTRQSCHRTLTMGYPGLGTTVVSQLNEATLYDWGRDCDWERAGDRVHVVGQGFTKTLQGAGAVADGALLLEVTDDWGQTAVEDDITARARDLRRLSKIPVRTFTAVYYPHSALPFGFCDLGDKVPFELVSPPALAITSDHRRVVQISVTPSEGDAPERVALGLNLPLDEIGA